MVTHNENIENLIVQYLKGEASPEQAIQIETWKKESESNNKIFLDLEKTYALTHNLEVFKIKNKAGAWGKIESQMHKENRSIPLWQTKGFYIKLAAVFIVVFGLFQFWRGNSSDVRLADTSNDEQVITIEKEEATILVASQKVKSFTLSDNSKIELQPGSELIISSDFNKNGRKVELKGSGKFNVKHDEKNPFSVKVKQLEVFDLGTVFRIDNLGDTVKISVDEGIVELRLNGKVINMVEGDSAFYSIKNEVISRYKNPISRIDHTFEFDGTSLKEVAQILSEFFNKKIEVKNKEIEDCTLSVTFKNEDLVTILDIIKELMDVQIENKKNTIGIYGKGCN